jgi:hypothetical protein
MPCQAEGMPEKDSRETPTNLWTRFFRLMIQASIWMGGGSVDPV